MTAEDLRLQAVKTKGITEDMAFPYLRWNPSTRQTEVDQVPPLSQVEMEQKLGQLQEAFKESANCIRFHALASQESQAEVIPWRLQISVRNDRLASVMKSLCHSSIWLLLSARMREHGTQRSKLAQELQRLTQTRRRT